MSKSNYYAGGFKVSRDGAPCRVAFKFTPNMVNVMRVDRASFDQDKMAEKYARWLADRDGISLAGENIRAFIETETLPGRPWGAKYRRVARVRFETGSNRYGRYGRYDSGWSTDKVLAVIEIPHWDFEQPEEIEPMACAA